MEHENNHQSGSAPQPIHPDRMAAEMYPTQTTVARQDIAHSESILQLGQSGRRVISQIMNQQTRGEHFPPSNFQNSAPVNEAPAGPATSGSHNDNTGTLLDDWHDQDMFHQIIQQRRAAQPRPQWNREEYDDMDFSFEDSEPEDTEYEDSYSERNVLPISNQRNIAAERQSPKPPALPDKFEQILTTQITSQQTEEGLQCSVCLEDYDLGQTVCQCVCKHYFHTTCLSTWLEKQSTCPLCREQVLSKPDSRIILY